MKKKSPYRIRNWSEYNASLKQRGSGAIWVSSEATANGTTRTIRTNSAKILMAYLPRLLAAVEQGS
jgi:hypothetical protein